MDYFNDIQFVAADVIPGYNCPIDSRYYKRFSLAFIPSGRMYFGTDHGRQVIFSRPTVYWLRPGCSYQYGPVCEAGYEHYYVTFRGTRGRRLIERGLQMIEPRGYMFVQRPKQVGALFRELIEMIRNYTPRLHGRAVLQLEELLETLAEDSRTQGLVDRHRLAIERIARLIRRKPYDDYDIDALSEAACLSESHFRKLFRQYIGTAIGDYGLICKMRRAATELEKTTKTARQIAREAGYDDPAQFSKMFKKKIGLSPRDYRHSAMQTRQGLL
jgi:AraC-like DNA-binding protein